MVIIQFAMTRTIGRYMPHRNTQISIAGYAGTAWRNRHMIGRGIRTAQQWANRLAGYGKRKHTPGAQQPFHKPVGSASGNANYFRSGYRPPIRFTKSKKRRVRRGMVNRKRISSKGKLNSALFHHLCTPQVVKWTFAEAYSGVQGQRQWANIFLGGESIVQYMRSKKPSNFLYNTSGTSTATLQDLGQKNYVVSLDKLIYDLRIQNRSNASMELKIYECLVRKNTNNSQLSIDSSAAGIKNMFVADQDASAFIGQTGNLGPGQTAFPTGVTHQYQAPTFTPYMSGSFVSMFKVLKQTKVILGPNEITSLKESMRPRTFKGAFIESAQSTEWQAGWSKTILFSWVGQMVDDATPSHQTKAKCDLFFQYDAHMKFHFLPGQSPLYNVEYLAANSTAGSTAEFGPPLFGYSNATIGGTSANQYDMSGSTPTVAIPATETIQFVPGYASTGGTVTNTDTTTQQAP